MKFKELGYASKEDYFKEFFSSLLDSNRTAQFFVNWTKVYAKVQSHLDEISLLNGLVNISNYQERAKNLERILIKYPKTRELIPLIIATRDQKIDLLLINKEKINYLQVNFNDDSIEKIISFCNETGIIELLGKVKDLHSYLTGVEVGMDTNARKNRSGTAFEEMVLNELKSKGIDARKPNQKFELGRSKKFDLVIYKGKEVFAVLEINFFQGVGSKPLETIQSYITLQKEATAKGITFILITDGPAWKTAEQERMRAFDQIDYPLNFKLASKLIPRLMR